MASMGTTNGFNDTVEDTRMEDIRLVAVGFNGELLQGMAAKLHAVIILSGIPLFFFFLVSFG